MAVKPTPEQERAVEAFLSGEDLKLVAVAGSGKTTTLRLIGESAPRKKFLYLVFNRALREEAQAKLPPNVESRTLHSLAYGKMKARYPELMEKMRDGGRVRPYHLSQAFDLKPIDAYLARMVLENFLRSSEEQPNLGMFPREVFALLDDDERRKAKRRMKRILAVVRKAWEKMKDPLDPFPLSHDGYVKFWAMEGPKLLDWDVILTDEAQDLDPVFLRVLESQGHLQRIYAGDPAQQIYAWRGAVNAMARLSGLESTLSWSFRFDEGISSVVRNFMEVLGRPIPIQGKAPWKSQVVPFPTRYPYTVLARTNLGLIEAYMTLSPKRPHVLGGVKELQHLIRDAADLYYGRPRTNPHPELLLVQEWDQLEELAEETGEASARILVSIARKGV